MCLFSYAYTHVELLLQMHVPNHLDIDYSSQLMDYSGYGYHDINQQTGAVYDTSTAYKRLSLPSVLRLLLLVGIGCTVSYMAVPAKLTRNLVLNQDAVFELFKRNMLLFTTVFAGPGLCLIYIYSTTMTIHSVY
jgi:hypothetical protein